MYMTPSEEVFRFRKVCNHPDGDSRSRVILMEVEAMSSAQDSCTADPELVFRLLGFRYERYDHA